MRALSIAVAIALRRHVRSCSPRVLHHTHPVDLACFAQVSMSAIQCLIFTGNTPTDNLLGGSPNNLRVVFTGNGYHSRPKF